MGEVFQPSKYPHLEWLTAQRKLRRIQQAFATVSTVKAGAETSLQNLPLPHLALPKTYRARRIRPPGTHAPRRLPEVSAAFRRSCFQYHVRRSQTLAASLAEKPRASFPACRRWQLHRGLESHCAEAFFQFSFNFCAYF